MARAQPVTPAGEPERLLLEAVESPPFVTVAAFVRAVAQETRLPASSEKSSFYRIVREGSTTAKAAWRREIYARLLDQPDAPWLISRERSAVGAAGEASLRGRLEELASDLAASMEDQARLNRRIQTLQARVRKLEARDEPPGDASTGRPRGVQ